MKINPIRLGALSLLAVVAASCVNDGYDLADIDTTSQFEFNDLTLPLNVNDIQLDQVMTFGEDSKITEVTMNGTSFYALHEKGSFDSEPITIAKIVTAAPDLPPTRTTLNLFGDLPAIPDVEIPGMPKEVVLSYEMTRAGNDMTFSASNIDKSILELHHLGTTIDVGISLKLSDFPLPINGVKFTNLELQLLKGLECSPNVGSYDAATGIWLIPELNIATPELRLAMHATGINFKQSGATFADQTFTYDGGIYINGGIVSVTAGVKAGEKLPSKLDIGIDYECSGIEVNSFSGRLQYNVESLSIPNVSLADLPDFLSDDLTNIRLACPQIYLRVNNPLGGDKITVRTGLTLKAIRHNGSVVTDFSPDRNEISVGYNAGTDGPYCFALAPSFNNLPVPDLYKENRTDILFTSLSDLLAAPRDINCAGLPEAIGITFDNPCFPAQDVTDFRLGRTIPGIQGNYDLIAPLGLLDGSLICYSTSATGWSSSSLEGLDIKQLKVTASLTNQCPLGVEIVAYPLDKEGRRIAGVTVKATPVAPNTTAPFELLISGDLNGAELDGMEFVAFATGSSDNTALAPSQRISIKNLRISASGKYLRKL